MSIMKALFTQFAKPRGFLGIVAGYIMSNRSSNIERSLWGISLLNLQSTDHVLETGFGPGIGIQKMSEIVNEGYIWGIDHSQVMFRQASRRNQKTILAGRVKLLVKSVSQLPEFNRLLDKIIDVNGFQFWEEKVPILGKLRTQLRRGGVIALVYQPRNLKANEDEATAAGLKFAEYLASAGFTQIRVERKLMKPVSSICALGTESLIERKSIVCRMADRWPVY